jgi:hypothetical protein
MQKRRSIFDRLALKQQLEIRKKMRSLSALHDESVKIANMRDTLQEIADQDAGKRNAGTAFALRSAAQFDSQIRDQLDTAVNRCHYLDQEIKGLRTKIAEADRRREKSTQLARDQRRAAAMLRDSRQEDDDASRRGRRT